SRPALPPARAARAWRARSRRWDRGAAAVRARAAGPRPRPAPPAAPRARRGWRPAGSARRPWSRAPRSRKPPRPAAGAAPRRCPCRSTTAAAAAGGSPRELPVQEAAGQVVVHHAARLHERVADGRAHEAETAPREVLAERVRDGRARRHLLLRAPAIHPRPPVDEAPEIRVEAAERLLHREKRARVRHRRLDLEAVAHDAGIGEQARHPPAIVARDARGIEIVERGAVGLALAQDGDP